MMSLIPTSFMSSCHTVVHYVVHLLADHVLTSKARQAIAFPRTARPFLQATSRDANISLTDLRETFIVQDAGFTGPFLRGAVHDVGANILSLLWRDGHSGCVGTRSMSTATGQGKNHHGRPKNFGKEHLVYNIIVDVSLHCSKASIDTTQISTLYLWSLATK
jgi:hypothetical protein